LIPSRKSFGEGNFEAQKKRVGNFVDVDKLLTNLLQTYWDQTPSHSPPIVEDHGAYEALEFPRLKPWAQKCLLIAYPLTPPLLVVEE